MKRIFIFPIDARKLQLSPFFGRHAQIP